MSAAELENWAEQRSAQDELPLLVRMLVTGSIPRTELRRNEFRTGTGVQLPGWDGQVEATQGNAWVPKEASVWELGTSRDTTHKANEDYVSRTGDPLGINPADAVFVFVTPRRWRDRAKWETAKRAEGIWNDVRALDADSLEAWLEATPAVHVRATQLLGRDPGAAADLISAWNVFAHRTAPPLPPNLFTIGRAEEVERVQAWLRAAPTTLAVRGSSAQDAFAFLVTCLLQLPADERLFVEARTVVVYTVEAWGEILARATGPLLLIPMFPEPATAAAVNAGHHVALPAGPDELVTGERIELSRPSRDEAKGALMMAGVPEQRAEELAILARRNILVLQRQLAADLTVKRPDWADPLHARDVITALLVGAWRNDVDADRDVLGRIAGKPYEELADVLTAWSVKPDSPVDRVGNNWFITSKEDAWTLTSKFLTSDVLDRFHSEGVRVLTAVDPALELEPSQRWAAGLLTAA